MPELGTERRKQHGSTARNEERGGGSPGAAGGGSVKRYWLEDAGLGLMLCVGLCADSLGSTPGGWYIMAGILAVAVILFEVGQRMAYPPERERTCGRRKHRSAPDNPEHTRSKTSAKGKKKAATVVATPWRQVKQSRQAIISHPCFIGVKGVSQDGI